MITRPWFYFVIFSVFSCGAMADDSGHKDDCYAVSEGLRGEGPVRVCVKLFPELWVHRDFGYIEVTGYISYINGDPYIFASKDLYFYSGGKGGVALDVPPSEKARFEQMVANASAVTIAGLYSPDFRGGHDAIGRIEIIGRHYWLQEMPGEQPRLPVD